jgi:DNA-binding CsgD family transcriptional regulator
MPPDLVRALLEWAERGRQARSRSVNLTGRERETLGLLVKGLSNKQIARRLAISSHGAKRLVASVMLKLDAPNRTLAAVTAVRTGIVAPD